DQHGPRACRSSRSRVRTLRMGAVSAATSSQQGATWSARTLRDRTPMNMGRRLVVSTLAVVVVVVLLLGVPLGVAMRNGIESSANDSLRTEAQRLLNTVEVNGELGKPIDPTSLNPLVSHDRSATVTLPDHTVLQLGT